MIGPNDRIAVFSLKPQKLKQDYDSRGRTFNVADGPAPEQVLEDEVNRFFDRLLPGSPTEIHTMANCIVIRYDPTRLRGES